MECESLFAGRPGAELSGLYLACEGCGITLPHDHLGTICDACEDSGRLLSADPRADVLKALQDGPRSSDELGCDTGFLRAMEADGLVKIDADRWPDEYVPGNPFIARLPADNTPWPGWSRWT